MKNVPLVGLCGRAQSGKDSVGQFMSHFGFQKLSYAHRIKDCVKRIFDLTDHQLEDGYEKELPLIEWDGLAPRQIMQRFGTEVARNIHEDVWVKHLFNTIDKFRRRSIKGFVITDVRFDNEAKAILRRNGELWWVDRDTAGSKTGGDHKSEDVIHLKPLCSKTIDNNRSLTDLRNIVDNIIETDYPNIRKKVDQYGRT